MLTHKNKITKTFTIFHLLHRKIESFFNLCGTNPEIQYHNVVIPQFYHTPKYTTPTLHMAQWFIDKYVISGPSSVWLIKKTLLSRDPFSETIQDFL